MSMTRDMVIATLGLSRLALFDRAGVEFFPTGPDSAIRSFWVPALAAPVLIYAMLLGLPPAFSQVSSSMLYSIVGLGLINALCGYYLAAYSVCKAMDKAEMFPRYVTVNNWATILYLVALSPSIIVAVFDMAGPDIRQTFDQICTLVMLAYMWFIVRHALHLGGMAAVGMVVLNNLIFFIAIFGSSIILVQAAGGADFVQMQMESLQGGAANETGAGGPDAGSERVY